MLDPITVDQLAARVAVIEQRLGITPTPPPTPAPGPQVPAAPTGLRVTMLADGRPQLDWDPANPADSVKATDVLDLLNTDKPVQDTVTGTRSIRSALKPGAHRRYGLRHHNAAGVSPLSATIDVPIATPTPPPSPTPIPETGYPADLFGKNWYLTLPTPRASDGLATEIHQPALATYTSKYCEPTSSGAPGVVFRVWHGGATTSGSKNPRSELREEINNGAGHAAWSSTTGRHRMVVEGQVNRLTRVRPQLVIGQIHDAADDVTVFRVEGSNLWSTAGDDPHGHLLDSNFKLGTRYQIGFDVSNGVVSYIYNGNVVPWTLNANVTGCYMKVGAYLQSNPTSAPTESTDEYAEVVLYSATVTHS